MMRKLITTLIIAVLLGLSGCAYYNTFYNAKKFYGQASKEREKRLRSQTRQSQHKVRGSSRTSAAAEQFDEDRPSSQEMQNYAKAVEKASAVLKFYPKSKYVDDALMLLGKCFLFRREYPQAKRKFEELIELYSQSEFLSEAKLLLAKTHLELNEFEEAEEILSLLLVNKKTKPAIIEEAQQALGDLFYRQQRYELAADAYRDAVRKSHDKRNKALALYRLGDCLIEMKHYEEVPDILSRAVKVTPDNTFKSQAAYRLGEAQRLVGDYKSAIKTFTKLMAEEMDEKKLPMIKYQLAESIRLDGDIDEAIKWYEAIIEDHKRTDASARSYFSLGQIEEKLFLDFEKAKESYDKVRGEFANSEVAPEARERSENIASVIELSKKIAKLEGRAVDGDSTAATLSEDQIASAGLDKDNARIDVGGDGMWLYYIGRLRPPPKTLSDLSKADRERSVFEKETKIVKAGADSTKGEAMAASDSSEVDLQAQARKEYEKTREIINTKLQLAELYMLRFDMVDSAMALYIDILEEKLDTLLTAKALFSVAYIFENIKHDSLLADSLYNSILTFYPDTDQANAARRALNLPVEEKIDHAARAFIKVEEQLFNGGNYDSVLTMFNEIIDTYPESEFSTKAMYAQGWILEHRLRNLDSAYAVYSRLADDYPDSKYSKAIKSKIAAVDKVKKAEEVRQKAIADSIAAVEKAAADSASAVTNDSTVVQAGADSASTTTPDSMLTGQKNTDDFDRIKSATTNRAPTPNPADIRNNQPDTSVIKSDFQKPPLQNEVAPNTETKSDTTVMKTKQQSSVRKESMLSPMGNVGKKSVVEQKIEEKSPQEHSQSTSDTTTTQIERTSPPRDR